MTQKHEALTVSVYQGGQQIREVSFDRAIVNIGKQASSNLRLDDINISRKHAVLERRQDGQWRLTDLGSTNGTTVNGEEIAQVILQDGDRIMLGETTLVVHLGDQDQRAGPAGLTDADEQAPVYEIHGLGENTFYDVGPDDPESSDMVLEIALLWGATVLTIEHYDKPERVKVGEIPGCRFTIPSEALGTEQVTLIENVGGKFGLLVGHETFQGDVLIDGSVTPLGDLTKAGQTVGGRLLIDQAVRARIRIGEFMLLVSYSQMPARPKVGPLGAVDFTPHIYILISAIAQLAFLLFLSLMPEDQLRSRLDPSARRSKLLNVLKVAELEKEEEEEEEKSEEEKKQEEKRKKKLEVDKEIVTKKKDDSLLDKLAKKKKKEVEAALSEMTAEDRKKKLREIAATAGAAKLLTEDTGLLSSLLESDNELEFQGRRLAAITSLAGPDGNPLTAGGAIDPFGGTLSADSSSGGFASAESIGRAGADGRAAILDELGKKSGKRNLDDIRLKDRPIKPVAIASSATVSGRLDRKTVQKIIRRNLSGIKWCYQDALQRNPKIRGKVTLSFTILPSGRTQNPSARNKSFKDEALLKCIKRKMTRWKFPQPKDGGVVKVSYPLILKTR